jgi:predicted nucleic acid-binding Zn ribbon protein
MKLKLYGYYGLFRLWVLCGALWIAAALALPWYIDHAHSAVDELLVGVGAPTDCEARARSDRRVNVQTCRERLEQRAARQKTERLLWAFVPPLLVLPVGAGVLWVIRGFRRDRGGKVAGSARAVAASAPAAPDGPAPGVATETTGVASAPLRGPIAIPRRSASWAGS